MILPALFADYTDLKIIIAVARTRLIEVVIDLDPLTNGLIPFKTGPNGVP